MAQQSPSFVDLNPDSGGSATPPLAAAAVMMPSPLHPQQPQCPRSFGFLGVSDPENSPVNDHAALRERIEFATQFNLSLRFVIEKELQQSLVSFAQSLKHIENLLVSYVTQCQRNSNDLYKHSNPCGEFNSMDHIVTKELSMLKEGLLPRLQEITHQLNEFSIPKFQQNLLDDCVNLTREDIIAAHPGADVSPRKTHASNLQIHPLSYDYARAKEQRRLLAHTNAQVVDGVEIRAHHENAYWRALKCDNAKMRHALEGWEYDTPTVFAHLLLHTTTMLRQMDHAFDRLNPGSSSSLL